MKPITRIFVFLFVITDAFLAGKILLHGKNVQLLNPQGWVALQERDLLLFAIAIMLIGVVPAFVLAFYISNKYSFKNTKAKYDPDWESPKIQAAVWIFLTVIIAFLSVLVWTSAHALDPHKALTSSTEPVTIQVVALRWKWLFIYPEQNIATVNYVVFPEKTPLNFQLTASDTPMNSFWIPQLGGQIYAMGGMPTTTHLIADGIGEYRGSNAEINGAGFADMEFRAKSVSASDFNSWVAQVQQSQNTLDLANFNELAKPGLNRNPMFYSSTQENLFTTIVMKYMAHPKVASDQMAPETPQQKMHDMQMEEMENTPGS